MHIQSFKLIPDTMFNHGQARHTLSSSPPPPPRHSPPAVLSDQSGMIHNNSFEQEDLQSSSWTWRHSAALDLGMTTSAFNASTSGVRHDIREYDFLRCIDDTSERPPEPESEVDCTLHLGRTSGVAETSGKSVDFKISKSGNPLNKSGANVDIADDRVNHTDGAKLDIGNAARLQNCWSWSCRNQNNNNTNNYNNNNSAANSNAGGDMMMVSLLRENVPVQNNGGGGSGSRTSSNSSSAGSAVNPPSASLIGADRFSRDRANLSGWGSHLYGLSFTPGHNHHHQRLLPQAHQAVTSASNLSGLLSAAQRAGPINVAGHLFDLPKSSPSANFSRSLHHHSINSSNAAATNAHHHSHSYSYSRAKEASSYVIRICAQCKTMRTPLWRNGPQGPKSLCNACGIRYKKEERRSAAAKEADQSKRQPSDASDERSRLMDTTTTTTSEAPYRHQSEKRPKLANNFQ